MQPDASTILGARLRRARSRALPSSPWGRSPRPGPRRTVHHSQATDTTASYAARVASWSSWRNERPAASSLVGSPRLESARATRPRAVRAARGELTERVILVTSPERKRGGHGGRGDRGSAPEKASPISCWRWWRDGRRDGRALRSSPPCGHSPTGRLLYGRSHRRRGRATRSLGRDAPPSVLPRGPWKFTESVARSSTQPADRPLPRRAFELGFGLLALRARCNRHPRGPGSTGQGRRSPDCRNLRELSLVADLRGRGG